MVQLTQSRLVDFAAGSPVGFFCPKPGASYRGKLPGFVVRKGFGNKGIKFARGCIRFDLRVPVCAIKVGEPSPKEGQFPRCQLGDDFFRATFKYDKIVRKMPTSRRSAVNKAENFLPMDTP